MIDIIKGVFIGIGKVLPGVSGSLIAISLGVYERSINIIANPFKITKQDLIFMFNLSLGLIFSIFFFSNIIIFFLNKFYLETMFLFIGLITGCLNGLIKIAKKNKNYKNFIFLLLPFLIILFINNLKIKIDININILTLLILGIIESFTMIIPGISGTALFMYLGVYNKILKIISSINISVVFFIFGIILGFILLAKILSNLFNKYKCEMIYLIIGFTLSTLLIILKETLNCDYNIFSLLFSTFLFMSGYIITKNCDIL